MNKLIKSISALTFGAFMLTSAALAFPNPNGSAPASENWLPPHAIEVVAPQLSEADNGKTVHVRVTIDRDGNPSDIDVLFRESAQLEESIVKAVQQWKFAPAQNEGKAVETRVVIPLELKLDHTS
jgi:TonB family protein